MAHASCPLNQQVAFASIACAGWLIPKKFGPFPVVFSRYLDRGPVWIVGTEDGK